MDNTEGNNGLSRILIIHVHITHKEVISILVTIS